MASTTDENKYQSPYYYLNSGELRVVAGANAINYTLYNSHPFTYYYTSGLGTNGPVAWNAWNNAAAYEYSAEGTNSTYNNITSYYINDPSKVVKTVYDPSPVGYTVMPPSSISGFTAYGLSYGSYKDNGSRPNGGAIVWTAGNTKNINTSVTSAPSTAYGSALSFYTSAMSSTGNPTSTSTIDFTNFGRMSGTAPNVYTANAYYWTSNHNLYVTDDNGNLKDEYYWGAMFSFGTTKQNDDNQSVYSFTVRNQMTFSCLYATPIRCTKEE